MEKKLHKRYLSNCNFLIVQDLWLSYYQIVLIILLKKFMKLNAKSNTIIKTAKRVELNKKIVSAVVEDGLILRNVYVAIKITRKSLMKF